MRPLESSRVRSISILLCDKIALMSPIPIERITPLNIGVFKDVRLRALQEAPYAFGSTYAREVQFDDAEWARRVERWNGERGVGFVAMHGAAACGIAGSLLDDKDPTHAQLVSMWTARPLIASSESAVYWWMPFSIGLALATSTPCS